MRQKLICAGSLTMVIKEYFDDCGVEDIQYTTDLGSYIKLVGLDKINEIFFIENTDNIYHDEWNEMLSSKKVKLYSNNREGGIVLNGLRLVEFQWDVLGLR